MNIKQHIHTYIPVWGGGLRAGAAGRGAGGGGWAARGAYFATISIN